jgi:tetratricopeptide (TPR) repeat protein
VIPVLLEGAQMPPHAALSKPIRKLAFRHALPIRADQELDRDLGRLVTDLEVHLQYSPAKVYQWDYWLLPVGLVGSVLCLPFLFLWLADLCYWNYGYETVQRYRQARFWLTAVGPLLLGAWLSLSCAGFVFRRYRRRRLQRAEHFRTGTGVVPPRADTLVTAALVLAVASLGWGRWAGGLALLLAGIAVTRRAWGKAPRVVTRGVVVACVIACVGLLWAHWRFSMTSRFEVALHAYEQGVAAEQQDRLDEARNHFQAAIEAFPRYGHAYQRLGLIHVRQNDLPAAQRELSRAIDRYPSGSRGLFGPDGDMIAAAYRQRADVAKKLGQDALAESDNRKVEELTRFMADLFAGILRWW